mmetsp:Transcript_10044/g.30281  ORF Transcript_10044/g.30281 Transcript_10044/m.30281 type:complete len:141 (-) Transcript_10044:1537-1959(-)
MVVPGVGWLAAYLLYKSAAAAQGGQRLNSYLNKPGAHPLRDWGFAGRPGRCSVRTCVSVLCAACTRVACVCAHGHEHLPVLVLIAMGACPCPRPLPRAPACPCARCYGRGLCLLVATCVPVLLFTSMCMCMCSLPRVCCL